MAWGEGLRKEGLGERVEGTDSGRARALNLKGRSAVRSCIIHSYVHVVDVALAFDLISCVFVCVCMFAHLPLILKGRSYFRS